MNIEQYQKKMVALDKLRMLSAFAKKHADEMRSNILLRLISENTDFIETYIEDITGDAYGFHRP